MIRTLSLVCLLLVSLIARAEALHLSSENLNLPAAALVENAQFILAHRFYGQVSDSFLGMDSGANVALGMGFRLNERIDLTLIRSSLNKEYYLAGKCALTDGWSLSLGAAGKTNLTAQLIFSRGLNNDRLNFSLIPTLVNPQPANPTFALGLAGGLSFDVKLNYLENIELLAEYIPVITGYAQKYPTAAFGIKAKTWGHFFALLLANSVETLPGGYLTGSPDNVYHFGFSIARKF